MGQPTLTEQTRRRQELVSEAMSALAGVADLPLKEQQQRLSQTQELLATVLTNPAEASQLGIPGMGR